jgi:DNA topoisomerase VI subunit B
VLLRFANRIPLVFDEGSDVITKTANELKYVFGLELGMSDALCRRTHLASLQYSFCSLTISFQVIEEGS